MLVALLLMCGLGAAAAQDEVELMRPAPELSARLPDGRKLLLAKYRGKVVALSFIYTTCPHCRHALQTLNKLQKEYGPRGFQSLGVAFNDDAAKSLSGFLKQSGIQYPFATCGAMDLFDFLNIPAQNVDLPQLIFIDRKGMIREYFDGSDPFFADEEKNMRATIEKLLNEPAAKAKGKPKRGPERKREPRPI
jgi:peroxiredoxin